MQGFFDTSITHSKKPVSLLPRCGACGLLNHCTSPKIPVTGRGRSGILLVGDAPGTSEDFSNSNFAGKAGQFLRKVLKDFDVDLDNDCWMTYALICKPEEFPSDKQIDYCRPNLMKTIRDLNPRIVIPLGFAAMKSFIAPYYRGEDEGTGSILDWAGWRIPLQKINTWVCPTFSPDTVVDMKEDRNGPIYEVQFRRHIERAVACESRPWSTIPDYKSEVEVMFDPSEAAKWIREITRRGGPSSFDYETNCLKPDREEAEIHTIGICWKGVRTMACPFVGEVVEATKEYLISGNPKIGCNTKFEERWSRKKLGVRVNRWVWDIMQSAHHLDNRKGITSAKFQSFIRLGQEPWDGAVSAFLQAGDAVSLNRIKECDLRTLLIYNGVDGICEYKVAEKQKEEMLEQNRIYDGQS